MKQETIEEAAERFRSNNPGTAQGGNNTKILNAFKFGAEWQQEQILQFLYLEITERRPYSSSKMCEKVIEFIEQLNNKK